MLEVGGKLSATVGFWTYFESRVNKTSRLEVMSVKGIRVKNNPRV